MRLRLNEDVVLVGSREAFGVGHVAVNRHVAEKRVPAPQTQAASQESPLTGCIDHEAGTDGTALSAFTSISHAGHPLAFKQHIDDLMAFPHLNPPRPAVVQ